MSRKIYNYKKPLIIIFLSTYQKTFLENLPFYRICYGAKDGNSRTQTVGGDRLFCENMETWSSSQKVSRYHDQVFRRPLLCKGRLYKSRCVCVCLCVCPRHFHFTLLCFGAKTRKSIAHKMAKIMVIG